jgi:transglutaminase/protease-like cytokinesis protein 3
MPMWSSVLMVSIVTFCCPTIHGQISDFKETDFHKADSIAERYAAHSLHNLKGLADKLTAPLLSEQEKFRSIYRWVCSNIEVDYALVTLNKRTKAKLHGDRLNRWNKEFNAIVYKTLLDERKTICTGYAYLVRELAFHAGLSCEIDNGYARPAGIDFTQLGPVNHSWNLVQLNKKWYLCDATWSSGIFSLRSGQFIKKYNDEYFLSDPTKFFQNHHSVHSLRRIYEIQHNTIIYDELLGCEPFSEK